MRRKIIDIIIVLITAPIALACWVMLKIYIFYENFSQYINQRNYSRKCDSFRGNIITKTYINNVINWVKK